MTREQWPAADCCLPKIGSRTFGNHHKLLFGLFDMESLIRTLSETWKGFNSLPPGRKMSILAAAALTVLGIVVAVFFANEAEYRVLFSNLSTEDAASITSHLQEKKIPYKLSPSGDTISVAADKVSEVRLELASSGLPKGGGVGFEIFDAKNLGVTEFVQQMNYQRALQGELSRTINSIDEVQQSRVHLVIPKKSLFAEEQKKATASVIVKLKSGRTLQDAQIQGIAHLVASSIEGLNPQDVMIIDNSGKVLSKIQDQSELAKMSNGQVEYKKNVEKEMTNRIQTMLEKVVGEGKAVVRISADLDFRVQEKTEEKFDSEEPAIRSVQRQSEKSATGSLAGESTTVPTARPAAAPARTGGLGREKTDETINYEISRTVQKTVMPVGDIKKLSIAVLVDGVYTKNDKGAEEYQPRSEKEMAALDDLVKKSAGFDVKRGDQVVVSNVPFKKVDMGNEAAEQSWTEGLASYLPLMKYVILMIAVVLVVLFVVRPLVAMLIVRGRETAGRVQQLPTASPYGEVTGGEGVHLSLTGGEQKMLTEADVVKQMANADAKKFAELLRNWMK